MSTNVNIIIYHHIIILSSSNVTKCFFCLLAERACLAILGAQHLWPTGLWNPTLNSEMRKHSGPVPPGQNEYCLCNWHCSHTVMPLFLSTYCNWMHCNTIYVTFALTVCKCSTKSLCTIAPGLTEWCVWKHSTHCDCKHLTHVHFDLSLTSFFLAQKRIDITYITLTSRDDGASTMWCHGTRSWRWTERRSTGRQRNTETPTKRTPAPRPCYCRQKHWNHLMF